MSGPFHIEWSPTALSSLDRLPEKAATACVEFAYRALADAPHGVGRSLRLELTGKHRARRGDFRVTYEIDDDAHVVTIVSVDHRSEVYRSR